MIIRIWLNDHEPEDLQNFGYQKNELRADHHTPALRTGHPITVHKTSDPDHKCDNCKLPEVDEWNRRVLDAIDDSQNGALRPVLQKFKSGGFISIKLIFTKSNARVQRQSRIKSSLLSAANNDLVSLSFGEKELTNSIVCLRSYEVYQQI
jgi:hypothetical protein